MPGRLLLPSGIDYGNPVSAHPLNRGLVSWWLPLPNWSGGTRLFDLTRRYDGTLTNGPTWAPGPNGFGALNFDGSNDYVEITGPGTNLAGDHTCSFWVRFVGNGTGSAPDVVCPGNGNNQYGAYRINASAKLGVYYNTPAADKLTTATFPNGGPWRHVVQTYSASATTLNWYVEGVLDSTHTGTKFAATTTFLRLGARSGTASLSNSVLSDVSLWSRVLSAGEVFALYDQSRRGYPDLLNRVRPWSFGVAGGGGGGTAVPVFVHHLRMQGIA